MNVERHKYVKIHVCQASYGDCLAIEFDDQATTSGSLGLEAQEIPINGDVEMEDNTNSTTSIIRDKNKKKETYKLLPKNNITEQRQNDASRKVILIDGGPANYTIQGTVMDPTTPLANMYAMLNSLLPPGCPNSLDTVVITHDDEDHINGIHQLMMSMADKSGRGNKEFRFNRGIEALNLNQSPFDKIWYNSPTIMFNNPKAKGWFDRDLDQLRANWPLAGGIPMINSDFGNKILTGKDNGLPAGVTRRAHLRFEFLSPNIKQIDNLKDKYERGKPESKKQQDKKLSKTQEKVARKQKQFEAKWEKDMGIEYKGLPNAKGSIPSYSNDLIAKRMRVTKDFLERVATGAHGTLDDASAKNQSSLVFTVKDDAQSFSAAFTGDGNAVSSFLPNWDGEPLQYDVMKVMHHGSKHNNCWSKKAVKDRITALGGNYKSTNAIVDDSPAWNTLVPENCRAKSQDEPSRFFLNVPARKYIISSSTTEGHRNPHLSTLAGIITRAIVRQDDKPVDIYLTTQSLQAQVQGFLMNYGPDLSKTAIDENTIMTEELLKALLLKPPGQGEAPQLYWDANGDCYRVWQLRTEIEPKYGSIMIEPTEGHPMMNPAWQRVALSMPFWIAYHLTYFTTDVQVTIGRKVPFLEEDLKRPTKRRQTGKGEGKPNKAKKSEILMASSNGLVGQPGNESGIFSMGVDPDFADTIDSLMPQDLGTSLGSAIMSNSPETMGVTAMAKDKADLRMEVVWDLAVGPRGLSPNALERFDIRVSKLIYDTVVVQEDVEMKILTGADAFLSHLSLRGWLQPDQITALKMTYMIESQIDLGGIISLVFEDFLKTSFFSLLPIKLDKKALFSSTPAFWPLSEDLKATVVDSPRPRDLANDFSDVKSLSFSVKPPAAHQKWDIQYEVAGNQTATWQVKVLSELRFFIYRPFERDFRYVYGSFLGKLSNGQGSNVIVDFLWFPDKDSGLDYYLRFADDDFVADGYVMKVGDLWSAIPPSFSTINTLAAAIFLPGKDTALEFGDLMRIQDCGFVVRKNSPVVADVTLRRIFGTIMFDPKQEFKPFGDMIKIRLPKIGLHMENLFSTVPMKLFVRIEEQLDIQGFIVPIIFETRRSRGGDKTIYQLSYIASSLKQGLTPARLLNWLGIPSTNLSDIPGLQKLLDSLHVLSFGLGWLEGTPEKSRTKTFSAKPDFMELAIRLDQLDLVPEYLAVGDAFLELRLDQQGSGFKTSLTSYARLRIGNCDVQFLISYGDRPEWESVYAYDGIPGHFRLALSTGDTGVLSLSNILGHFMPNVQCLPPALHNVLLRTGISKFRLGIGKDEADKNEIAMIHLEVMLEEDDMEIFEGLSISSPKLTLRINYPNDEDARTISASISVLTDIRDEEFNATIWVDAKEDTIIGMSIMPVNESIALGEVIAFFSKKMSESFKFDLPSDFSFMQDVNSGPMHVSFRKTPTAGYKLDSVFVHVEANRDFELWDSPRVVLSDVKFLTNYIRNSGVHVGFGVSLAVGNYDFSGALFYDHASTDAGLVHDSPKDEKPKDEKGIPVKDGGVVSLGKDKGTSYTVQLEFQGEVGLHDILSTLTGTNFADMLPRTGLEAFSKYTDIKIHTIALALANAPSSWTFSVVANLDWLAFTNMDLTASHETSWAFNLQLQCKDGPLKILPDSWAASVARFINFGDTSIYLFYGPISNTLRGQQLTLSDKSQRLLGDKGGVAISTNLNFGSDLEILREWLKLEGLQVFGAAGAGFFVLGVKIGMLTLMDDAFKLSGGFLLSYIDNELWIGVEGDFAFNIPAITKSTITGTIAAGVNLSTGGLGLKANTNEALKDVGGIKGFDLDAVAFEIELAPEAELIPTTLGVEGGVRVEGLDNVSGRLAVKFVAKSPMNCYVEGKIENLNLTGLLAKFAAAIDLPLEVHNFLQKNGVNLRFLAIQVIPKDMVGMTNQQLKRRIYFEGALSIVINDKPIWAGFVLLDIKDSGFAAIALMDPVRVIDPNVFSIQRSSRGVSAAAYNLQLPQVKPEYLTPSMLNEGPVLKIATEGPDPVFVSADLRFLGTQHDMYAVVNGDSFVAEFHSKSSIGSLDFSVSCIFNSAIAIAAAASLDLGEHTLMLVTTLNALDGALDKKMFERPSDKTTLVGFSGGLKVGVAWTSGRDPLSISLSGHAQAFGKKWDIGEIGIKITESDLRSLEAFASQLWAYIKDSFTKLVMTWIQDIQTGITTAIKFLEENWKVASQELVRLVSDIKDIPITDIIVPVVKELDLIYKEALNLFDDLGIGKFLGVKLLSPLYGKDPPPDRRPGWEPDVPDDVLKLPKKPNRNDVLDPILDRDDILDGFPGAEKHAKKPDSPPKTKPVDPFKIPDDIGFGVFSTEPEPAFESASYIEAEHETIASPGPSSRNAEDTMRARLPAWFAKEIKQYVSSPISPVPSDSADEALAQISTFNYEEVLSTAKILRTAGLTASEVQQVYRNDFGQDMPLKLVEQI
ncbi:hypothetical protein ACHAP7_012068 [Fusarium lateritium]